MMICGGESQQLRGILGTFEFVQSSKDSVLGDQKKKRDSHCWMINSVSNIQLCGQRELQIEKKLWKDLFRYNKR